MSQGQRLKIQFINIAEHIAISSQVNASNFFFPSFITWIWKCLYACEMEPLWNLCTNYFVGIHVDKNWQPFKDSEVFGVFFNPKVFSLIGYDILRMWREMLPGCLNRIMYELYATMHMWNENGLSFFPYFLNDAVNKETSQ